MNLDSNNTKIAMLITGIALCSLGISTIALTQDYPFTAKDAFATGFLIAQTLIAGFMLIHKSLRGEWL